MDESGCVQIKYISAFCILEHMNSYKFLCSPPTESYSEFEKHVYRITHAASCTIRLDYIIHQDCNQLTACMYNNCTARCVGVMLYSTSSGRMYGQTLKVPVYRLDLLMINPEFDRFFNYCKAYILMHR